MGQRIDTFLARVPFGLLALATVAIAAGLARALQAVAGSAGWVDWVGVALALIVVQLLFGHLDRRTKPAA